MDISILSVDVGYGSTKFAYRKSGTLLNGSFRSLTPTRSQSALPAHAGAMLQSDRKTALITVDHTTYEIGPSNFIESASGDVGRNLTDDYPASKQYRALVGGVVTLEGIRRVELLVLGLPIHTIDLYSDHLIKTFTGTHDFGHGPVDVRRVFVIPQPLGSLYYAGTRFADHFSTTGTNVIVDVGYYTTDWVVAKGFELDSRRCGGKRGGASDVYRHIAVEIRKKLGLTTLDIERIDEAIRTATPYRYHNNEVELEPLIAGARSVIEPTVAELKSSVGHIPDANCIMLTGGGGALYRKVLQDAFPTLPIYLLPAPAMANATGFYVVAEMVTRHATAEGIHA
jgi:plasmid segregation protein ParM